MAGVDEDLVADPRPRVPSSLACGPGEPGVGPLTRRRGRDDVGFSRPEGSVTWIDHILVRGVKPTNSSCCPRPAATTRRSRPTSAGEHRRRRVPSSRDLSVAGKARETDIPRKRTAFSAGADRSGYFVGHGRDREFSDGTRKHPMVFCWNVGGYGVIATCLYCPGRSRRRRSSLSRRGRKLWNGWGSGDQ